MEYAKEPIIDLLGNQQQITIASNNSVSQTVTYGDGELSSEALYIRIKCLIDGDTSNSYHSFRYRSDVYMIVEILYYEDDDNDIDEQKQVLVVFPSNQYEKKKVLPLSYEIPINKYYIHTIKATLYNKTSSSLIVNKAFIRRQISEAEQYAEYTGINNNTLDEVQAYDNGCKLYYTNQTDPTTLVFVDDGQGNLVGIDVNPGQPTYKRILFNKNSGDVPQQS